jgi:murein peptide amidase A
VRRALQLAAFVGAVGLSVCAAPGPVSSIALPRSHVVALERVTTLGRSAKGTPIRAFELGDPAAREKVLVVGCIHGTECAGIAVARALDRQRLPADVDLWIIPNLNPDGFRRRTRQNARGVDLNRNFPAGWRAGGRRWDFEYPGPRPASEPETRIAMRLILRLRPRTTIWFHQPQDLVRAWGESVPDARRYARLAGLSFRKLPWLPGSAPNWQNHRFPGTSSFVVELRAGPLSSAAADRLARAVVRLAE